MVPRPLCRGARSMQSTVELVPLVGGIMSAYPAGA